MIDLDVQTMLSRKRTLLTRLIDGAKLLEIWKEECGFNSSHIAIIEDTIRYIGELADKEEK